MSDLMFWSGAEEGRQLSNFYSCPITVKLKRCDKVTFRNAESAYQCFKQPDMTWEKVNPFLKLTSKKARDLGKTVVVREDWDTKKLEAMSYILKCKFRDQTLRSYLLSTGDRKLVHFAPWDEFWGAGKKGDGQNQLGLMLMDLRENLALV